MGILSKLERLVGLEKSKRHHHKKRKAHKGRKAKQHKTPKRTSSGRFRKR